MFRVGGKSEEEPVRFGNRRFDPASFSEAIRRQAENLMAAEIELSDNEVELLSAS
jgi:hypothetical protein